MNDRYMNFFTDFGFKKLFGSVSQSVREKISTATGSRLEAWIDALLDAVSVEHVFKGPQYG